MIDQQTSRGPWIQTYTGRKFYPLDPQPEDICIEDIAHALSNLCRFTGHCRSFYSVAQHSVLVCELLGTPTQTEELFGLLHDASEAYIADVARPIKALELMNEYRQYEKKLQGVIFERFALPLDPPRSIKDADNLALAIEASTLLNPLLPGWDIEPLLTTLASKPRLGIPLSPRNAEYRFLAKFHSLTH